HSVWPPADGNGLPNTATSRMSHGARMATAARRLAAPHARRVVHDGQSVLIAHATAGATPSSRPSTRARVARPTHAPANTSHGPARAVRTAWIEAQTAAAPAVPKTAKASGSGAITSSGPAARTTSA